MKKQKTILITGAAGNLGGLLAGRMLGDDIDLRLMIHNRDVDRSLRESPNVEVFRADLGNKETLYAALQGVDVVIHFAGVLFRHDPEKFLKITNTQYFNNLMDVALECGVGRMVLASFPHVEGESSPENPARGRLDGNPVSVHATTRLEEERLLFGMSPDNPMERVVLRIGMVYGRGILMIDAARWFSRRCILGIWRKPNIIHLISTEDFLDATRAALLKEGVTGIYHLGDEGIQTLRHFLKRATQQWKTCRPIPMPLWMILTAARFFELWSRLFGTRAPLTVDFVRIGMVQYYGDTSRMRSELLPELKYPTFEDGIGTL